MIVLLPYRKIGRRRRCCKYHVNIILYNVQRTKGVENKVFP